MPRYQSSQKKLQEALRQDEIALPARGVFLFDSLSKKNFFVSSGLTPAEIDLAIGGGKHAAATAHGKAHDYDYYAGGLFQRYQQLYEWDIDGSESTVLEGKYDNEPAKNLREPTAPAATANTPPDGSRWQQSFLVFDTDGGFLFDTEEDTFQLTDSKPSRDCKNCGVM